jgi:hypothetical protein
MSYITLENYNYCIKQLLTFLYFVYAVLLFNKSFKEIYPTQYQTFLINTSYNLIYFYSKVEIIVKNIKCYLNEHILCYLFYENNKGESIIEVIFQGIVINKINKSQVNSLLSVNYDFILYSEVVDNLTHRRIIYSDNLDLNNENLFVCEPSEIKFVLSEVILGDKHISIDFRVNHQNYYVCDNIIKSKFIMYFLNEYYSEEIKNMSSDDIMNYKVEILDHNVNKETFDSKSDITIYKTTYCVLNK